MSFGIPTYRAEGYDNVHEMIKTLGSAATPEKLLAHASWHDRRLTVNAANIKQLTGMLESVFEESGEDFDKQDIEALRNIQANLEKMPGNVAAPTIKTINDLVGTILYNNPWPKGLDGLIGSYAPHETLLLKEMTPKNVSKMSAEEIGALVEMALEEPDQALQPDLEQKLRDFLKYASDSQRTAFLEQLFSTVDRLPPTEAEAVHGMHVLIRTEALFKLFPQELTKLTLPLPDKRHSFFIMNVFERCLNLEELRMVGGKEDALVTDEYLRAAKTLPNLKKLDIRGKISPTPENIATFRNGLPGVTVLIKPEDTFQEDEQKQ